jgi:hypothetical protein
MTDARPPVGTRSRVSVSVKAPELSVARTLTTQKLPLG